MVQMIGRRPFLLLAGSSLLAGCAARAMGTSSAPPPGGGTPTVVKPGGAWTGAASSGYAGSPPTDPTRTTAKPAIQMRQAWGQRFASDLVIGVDAGAVGGVLKVVAHVEGNRYDLPEILNVDTDVNGRTRRRQGFFIQFSRSDFTSVSPTGAVDVYFEAVPRDTTMQHRVIGPYRFYPRTTEFSGVYNIGSGQTYADLTSAIAAARAANEEAACLLIKSGGTYAINESPGRNAPTKGRWTIMCDTNVTATLARASLPNDPADNVTPWRPGIDGIEFRGKGLVIDYKNFSYVSYSAYPNYQGQPHRFNGATMINSAGRDSIYWYGMPRPQGLTGVPGFVEDCVINDIPACLASQLVVSCNRVKNTLYSGAVNTQYVAQNCIQNLDSGYFFKSTPSMRVKFTGTGTGRIYTSGPQYGGGASNQDYFLNFEKNGALVYSLKFGRKLSDGNNTWSQVVATLNANLPGSDWTVQWISDAFASIACTSIDTAAGPTFVELSTYFDFHQDMYHPSGSSLTQENCILRGNLVYQEGTTILGSPAFTFWRFADATAFKDVIGIDNACDISGGTSNGTPMSHVYIAGHSFGRSGWTPAANCDDYCRFESNIQTLFWANGTVASGFPHFVNCYINSSEAHTSSALPAPFNAGNTVVVQSSNAAQILANQSLFQNATGGDFRPVGLAASTKVPRGHSAWDLYGVPRAATDAPGALSVNASAPVWPFADPV
jgi:hypothetical protein